MNTNVDYWMRMGQFAGGLTLWMFAMSACIPPASPLTRVEATVNAPPPIVVVPAPPTVHPTPTPTAVLPSAVVNVIGSWVLNLNYRLIGYPVYSDIRYTASLPLTVGLDGALSGNGRIYTTLVQPPCSTQLNTGNGASVTIGGQIETDTPPSGSGTDFPMADLTLTPQGQIAIEIFQLICSDTALSDTRSVSILWSALTAAGQLHVRIPFRPGIVLSGIRDVTVPSDEAIFGALAFQIRIGQ